MKRAVLRVTYVRPAPIVCGIRDKVTLVRLCIGGGGGIEGTCSWEQINQGKKYF